MKTISQIIAEILPEDRNVVRFYLDHNRQQAAINYVRDVRPMGSTLAKAVVTEIYDMVH